MVLAAAAFGAALAATAPAQAITVIDGRCVSVSDPNGCAFSGNITAGTALATQNAYNTYNNLQPSAQPDITLNWLFKNDDPGRASVITEDLGTSGTWATPGFLIEYIAVKAGTEFVLYRFNAPTSSGSWSSANILNKNGRPQDMSHVSFFGTAVPEPATWAMMIGGFGLIGAAARRRRRAARPSLA
jgi:hypothetical protein